MNSTTNEEKDLILKAINYCYIVVSIVGTFVGSLLAK